MPHTHASSPCRRPRRRFNYNLQIAFLLNRECAFFVVVVFGVQFFGLSLAVTFRKCPHESAPKRTATRTHAQTSFTRETFTHSFIDTHPHTCENRRHRLSPECGCVFHSVPVQLNLFASPCAREHAARRARVRAIYSHTHESTAVLHISPVNERVRVSRRRAPARWLRLLFVTEYTTTTTKKKDMIDVGRSHMLYDFANNTCVC